MLGFGIYYKNCHGKIEQINYDLIFNGSQDGLTVVKAFKFLLKQEFFKNINKKKYVIWADTGTHFRCSQVVDFFLTILLTKMFQLA